MARIFVWLLTASLLGAVTVSAAVASPTQKTVLVTGASSGIGRRIAETLANEGFLVFAGARKAEDIAALSALDNVTGVRLDVTQQSDIDAAVDLVRSHGQGLYGLVNNAGVFLADPLVEVSERDMDFIIDVNVMGPYRVTKAFAPLIIESGGRITTTGSIASLYAGALFGPYSISKAAMDAYTEALAAELGKFGVAVSIVLPGNFRSDIMRNMARRQARDGGRREPSLWAEEIARFGSFTQEDRSNHADPRPVADAVVEFMSTATPRLRYLVTPNEREADFAMRSALKRVVELNQGQPYELSRPELISVLDVLLDSQVSP